MKLEALTWKEVAAHLEAEQRLIVPVGTCEQHGPRHACEAETSVMLHLHPEMVRKAEIQDFDMPFEEFRHYLLHERTERIEGSPGSMGYPSHAGAEKGGRLFALMKRRALEWIKGECETWAE